MARDAYDLEHEETGSGNISKASAEWRTVLREARQEAEGRTLGPDEFVLHIAYAIVNRRAAAGEPWNKCIDCGSPYVVGVGNSSAEFCSQACGVAYTAEFEKSL